MESGIEDEVAVLRDEVASLRADVDGLREDQALEVRTQRVSVVDEAGVERVVLSAQRRAGSVLVTLPSASPDRTNGVELYAAEYDHAESEAGFCLIEAGEVTPIWRSS